MIHRIKRKTMDEKTLCSLCDDSLTLLNYVQNISRLSKRQSNTTFNVPYVIHGSSVSTTTHVPNVLVISAVFMTNGCINVEDVLHMYV